MAPTLPPPKRLSLFQALYAALLFSLPWGQESLSYLLLLALFLLSIGSLSRAHWALALRQKGLWLSAAFYLWYALSLLWSEDVASGLRQMETKLSFLLAPPALMAFGLFSEPKAREKILQVFVWGNVSAILWALAKALWLHWNFEAGAEALPRPNFFVYERLSRSLMHPGYLASFIGVAILANAQLITQKATGPRWFSLVILLTGLFLLQARMNLLALLLVSLAYLVYRIFKLRLYRLLLVPLVLLALGLSALKWAPPSLVNRYLAFPRFDYDISGDQFNSATYRLAEWHCAKIGISREPWWGYGVGDARQALQDIYREEAFWAGLEQSYNAHNQYLESLLSVGIPGLLLLLGLLARYAWQASKSSPWMGLALAFFALCLLTESMLERAWGVLLLNLFFPFFSTQSLIGTEQGDKKERIEKAEKE